MYYVRDMSLRDVERKWLQMFNVGDAVFYGVHGVCVVEDISKKEIFGSVKDYYTLRPVYTNRSKVFVPVERAEAAVDLRKVITKEDVAEIIEQLKTAESIWIDDDAARKQKFGEILKHGTGKELASLIKTVYEKRNVLISEKKKMHAADERAFSDAEKILYEEFAFVLGIEKEQVASYITEKLA
ncbi:MAG: CarD family transcriptional regulator [Clostridia bacterium]|nr:CarD family transcriptional regulator [Clostridia bacterium]